MAHKSRQNLAQAAISSGFWFTCLDWFRRIGSITLTIFLARLLSPEDFGLI